ncbi:putative ribonuclease H-like domain-containing protein [Tanacetum coccineum]
MPSSSQEEIPPPPPPPPSSQTPTQQTPHTVSTIKLPILKKGEYDIWAMKMEHYLAHTDYPIWEVIQNGNGPVSITTDTSGQIKVLPPRTAEEIVARERERKARTTLLMALPEDHLAKFHKMTDAKEMWDAIKSRFGGNDESKKMQKYILKQQFEGFSVSNTEGLHKGYDRFQSLLSQLEIHGAGVSTEDANQKFLRSLPSAWSQVSLIMRTKPGVDSLSFDDLYNNLRVFESDIKGSTASSSSPQNVAFVSENTSSTNEVSTAYCVPNLSGQNTKYEQTSSYSLLANQSSCPQLDHEDLEQIDEYDLEEMDLKWQVAMISMRMKKFYKKTGRKLQFDAKEPVGFDKTKVECYNCHKTGHFARECRIKGTQDNRRRDAWNSGNKDGSRTGQKEDSKALVTIDGEGVDWTNHSEDEDYALMACNSSDSDTEVISCSNKCKESYANLKKLYDAQREQLNDASIEIKAYSQGHKKVKAQLVAHQQGQLCIAEGMHVVPPPMTGNYMPTGPAIEIDYSQFTYGPKQTQPSESESQSSECDTCESNINTEPSELVSQPVVNESIVECQPKIWSDAPIIEEYESDSEDEETVKNQFTHSQKPTVDKKELRYGFTVRACFVCGSLNHLIRDCDFHEKRMARKAELNNMLSRNSSQGEIRPIWNNVQRINKQNQFVPKAVLTRTGKILVNIARASSTKNVSTARQSFNTQTVLTSTAMKVNTVKPIVNRVRPANVFHKTHSPASRSFKKTTVLRTNFKNHKLYTAKVNAVSTVGKKRETAVKPSAALKNKGIVDSGCSRHMTGNKAYLAEFQDFNGYPVAFGGSKGYITGKGKIKTGKLDFEDVCFVKELQHFNLFSVSQICDKKNKVLFTDSECLVLSSEFKLPDENQVLLKIPRQNNMYSFNLENIVPSGGLACLIAKATTDESNKWHRRLGHVNFKNLNKLVKGNLVRGLPSKIFQNDHTCVACQKGKQHKASCKAKAVSSISHTLQLLHMDLFGPTSVRSLNHKTYCLVITDDFSRFSWVFFLRTKDETSAILKDFIRQIENQLNQKVKTIRSDNGTEFKNKDVIEFCGSKGIKREYNSFLPNTFWAEAVSTACYVLNRVLVTKPHNKTPYELLTGDSEKEDESTQDCFVLPIWPSYSSTITPDLKTTKKRDGPREEEQVFMDELERLKRQEKEANEEAEALRKKFEQETENLVIQEGAAKPSSTNIFSTVSTPAKASSTNFVNTVSIPVNTTNPHEGLSLSDPTNLEEDDSEIPPLEDIYQNSTDGIFTTSSYDHEGAVADFTNLETIVNVSLISTSRIHSSYPTSLILGDLTSAVQTRSKVHTSSGAHAFVSYFKIEKVWVLVDLPHGKKAIGTKQEEGIDYDEVFAPVARLEAIRIFLAFASYMGFIVYQIDVKNVFLYGKIDEEVYVSQPLGFLDPKNPQKVYKMVKALYGLHKAPRAWYATLSTFLLKNGYRRGTIDKTLFLKKDKHDIILVQVYVDDIIFGSTKKSWCDEFEALMKSRFQMKILKKFDFANVKTASTPIETQKPLVKDEDATDVDVHLYRSMIGSVMYLKGKPKLGLWYPRVSTFNLESYSDSDYAGANLDRKSITGGCQFLGRRLISWQCKKQTIVATSTTEAEYVAAASCCGQVLWIQNQMHHFIRDAYEKKLIQVLKIYTDDNVADLLTKAFDVSRGLIGFGDVLRRVLMVHEASVPTLFILWLDKVSTDSAKLVALGKVCTAIETLKKNTAKALISLFTTITLSNIMAVLDSCPKHNMVAYLEKTEGNAEFHEIIDFLKQSSIHHALTDTYFPKVAGKLMGRSTFSGKVNPFVCYYVGTPTQMRCFSEKDHLKANLHPPGLPLVEVLMTTTDSSPAHTKTSGGNLGGDSSSDKSLSGNEGEMTLQSVYDLCLSLCAQSMVEKCLLEVKIDKKELPQETKGAQRVSQDEGRTRDIMDEDKEIEENVLSTEDVLSTDKDKVSTDKEKVSTDRPIVSTDGSKVSTDRQIEGTDEQIEGTEEHNEGTEEHNEGTEEHIEGTEEHIEGTEEQTESTDGQRKGTEDQFEEGSATQATQTPTSTIFGDDETIAKVLLNMSQAKAVSREKEKGVELKDIEETDRPRPTSTRSLLTLKSIPRLIPKDKGKKKIEEEDESKSESDGIPEAEKKFKQLESDEETARKMQEEWEGEEERNRIAEEKAANEALIRNFDDIKARIEADRLLA